MNRIKRIYGTFLAVLFFWMVVLGVLMMDADVKKARRRQHDRLHEV